MKKYLLCFVVGVGFGAGGFWLLQRVDDQEPRTIAECVLEEMKGRTNKQLRFAVQACQEKFPPYDEPETDRVYTDQEIWGESKPQQ
jgi:hypothetical protein